MEKDKILQELKKQILETKQELRTENVGEVFKTGDGVAEIRGLSGVMYSEMLEFETATGKIGGIALNLLEDSVGAIILGDGALIKEGQTVKSTGKLLSVPVSDELGTGDKPFRRNTGWRSRHKHGKSQILPD